MTKPVRILLIEDNEDDVVRVREMLSAVGPGSATLEHVAEFDAGLQTICENDHDVCLIGLRLSKGDGLEFVHKAVDRKCETPIIVLSAAKDREVDIKALAAGAADCLITEELSTPLLVRSIRHALARQRYVAVARDHWKVEGSHQDLTELCKAAHEFADTTSHRFRTPLAVIKAFAKIIADGVVGDVNAEQKEHLGTILTRVDDLNSMINDMFEMSTLEAGVIGAARNTQPPKPVRPGTQPAAAPKAPVAAPDTAAAPQPDAQTVSSAPTVLIADDDDQIIQALTALIQGLGLNVVAATNGRDALTKFASHTCDLLILDIKMPGFDGLSVYEKILDLQFSEFILTPAILLTGKSDQASIERCAELHAHYVLKDADAWDKLKVLVCQVLKIPERASQAAE
ncbi:MAG: response regulator [Hyphomicrobiales bacterium]